MTDDLISRSELLKHCTTIRVTYHCQGADEWDDYEAILVKDVKDAPTVSPDEVRGVGEWRNKVMAVPGGHGQTYSRWGCSVCKKKFKERSDYCPSCGAKMEVSDDA